MSNTALNFVQRVLAKLTGGDEAKVTRFQSKVVKSLKAQVTLRKTEIDDYKEKLVDLDEKYADTLLDVDLESIKTTEAAEAYAQKYINKCNEVKKEIKDVKSKIKKSEEEITVFEEFIADLA